MNRSDKIMVALIVVAFLASLAVAGVCIAIGRGATQEEILDALIVAAGVAFALLSVIGCMALAFGRFDSRMEAPR